MQGSDTTLSATVMVDTRHYAFLQTPRMHNARSEPRGKLGDDDVSAQAHPWSKPSGEGW